MPPFLLCYLLLVSLASSACRSPARFEPEPLEASPSSAPEWLHQAPSWEKLESIEAWLDGTGPVRRPDLVAEAELSLAEGRLEFARRDAAGLPERTLAARLGTAEVGFRRVLALPGASALQIRRARQGLELAGELRRKVPLAAASVPHIVPRGTWHAAAPVPSRLTPHRGRYERITVHHSTTPTSELGLDTLADSAGAVAAIQRFHMRERGYGDIGYHFLIDPKGRIFAGRSLAYRGAHANGRNNIANIGICLLGNFEQEHPTRAALHSLEELIGNLSQRNRIPPSHVFGHRELRTTACPGRYLMSWVEGYRRSLARK